MLLECRNSAYNNQTVAKGEDPLDAWATDSTAYFCGNRTKNYNNYEDCVENFVENMSEARPEEIFKMAPPTTMDGINFGVSLKCDHTNIDLI